MTTARTPAGSSTRTESAMPIRPNRIHPRRSSRDHRDSRLRQQLEAYYEGCWNANSTHGIVATLRRRPQRASGQNLLRTSRFRKTWLGLDVFISSAEKYLPRQSYRLLLTSLGGRRPSSFSNSTVTATPAATCPFRNAGSSPALLRQFLVDCPGKTSLPRLLILLMQRTNEWPLILDNT